MFPLNIGQKDEKRLILALSEAVDLRVLKMAQPVAGHCLTQAQHAL
jgi:hypothetical protein